jgi:hypothetical protein
MKLRGLCRESKIDRDFTQVGFSNDVSVLKTHIYITEIEKIYLI